MNASSAIKPETFDCRVTFAETLIAMAEADERIVAVCNDSVGSSNLNAFRDRFPDRLINVGIAEQNMVGVAAGLANGGFIPFVCAAGPFLSGRATEQVKADIAYSNYGVVLCAMSPGMAYGELGPTHHSIEDLSWMRAIDNLDVLVPADPAQTRTAMQWAAASGRPVYMRVGRFKVPSVTPADSDAPFTFGKIDVHGQGTDVALVATGTLVSRALDAAALLKSEGISARVLNVSTIKPIDVETIVKAASETRGLVVAEEGVLAGGLGAAVATVLAEHHPARAKLMGVTSFAPTGSNEFLLEHFGLTAKGIADAARQLVG
ncbi:transketolase C-terminal domain-containing protein [Rhizobium sp. BK251]|uniref:transketolase family protein n=1 Tax=Rhizobium sp. BK251 TaxID=2512125 RepID=UPI00105047FD|nr:transketolase C-terminal domain-containing protein [Rhizobium sp. BK251]TCL71329.1 transketolase subunit B [Rhizobium sp. BK251]